MASRRWRLTGTAVLVASTLTHGLPVVCCGHRVLRHLLDRLITAGSPCESVEAIPAKPQPPRGQGRPLSPPSPHDHACVLASGDHDLHLIHQMYGHIPPQSTQWPSHTHYYNTHWPLGRQQGPSCRRAPTTFSPSPTPPSPRRPRAHPYHTSRWGRYYTTKTSSEIVSLLTTVHLLMITP